MGIKDLTVFLKEFASESITKGNLSHLGTSYYNKTGKKLRAAIDTSLFMYKYKYRSGDNFILEFLEQINRLLVNKIQPVYIFDGAPPAEKCDTLKVRKERKLNYKNKIAELETQLSQSNENKEALIEEIKKIKRKTISITSEDNAKLKYFLDLMNIKHIKSESEADIVCSKLSSSGLIDFVISEDMDHLTSGTKILLRDFNNKNNYVTMYNRETILTKLNFTEDQLIHMCILFGCDYVSRIRGMGYKTSYKMINKATIEGCSIESILKNVSSIKKNLIIPEDYIEKSKKAYIIFKNNINLEIDEAFFETDNDIFDNQIIVVRDYLRKYTTFSDQKIKNRIKNIFGYCI